MIFFLLTRVGSHTIKGYLRRLQEDALPLQIGCYEDIEPDAELEAGVYVFADLERLSAATKKVAVRLRTRLESEPGKLCLNDPAMWVDRMAFLHGLYAQGVNDFDVYDADPAPEPNRYPVFLRHRWDHTGARSALLQNADELRRALSGRDDVEDLVVTEFSETADSNGIYRKYSAFRVGDRVIPRHLFFSTKWMLKVAHLTDPPLLEEEDRFLRENPHAELVRSLFDQSGVEWGRIDYAFSGDAIRVWEINTNPGIVPTGDWGPRADAQRLFLDRLHAALEELETRSL